MPQVGGQVLVPREGAGKVTRSVSSLSGEHVDSGLTLFLTPSVLPHGVHFYFRMI